MMSNVMNIICGASKASEIGCIWGSRMGERVSSVCGCDCKSAGAVIGGTVCLGVYLYFEFRE